MILIIKNTNTFILVARSDHRIVLIGNRSLIKEPFTQSKLLWPIVHPPSKDIRGSPVDWFSCVWSHASTLSLGPHLHSIFGNDGTNFRQELYSDSIGIWWLKQGLLTVFSLKVVVLDNVVYHASYLHYTEYIVKNHS